VSWSVTDELAVTKRHLAEAERQQAAQITHIKILTDGGLNTAAAEHVLREIEATLATLRARRFNLEAAQRHP
jgi:Mg-chelatase subunit ChlD